MSRSPSWAPLYVYQKAPSSPLRAAPAQVKIRIEYSRASSLGHRYEPVALLNRERVYVMRDGSIERVELYPVRRRGRLHWVTIP